MLLPCMASALLLLCSTTPRARQECCSPTHVSYSSCAETQVNRDKCLNMPTSVNVIQKGVLTYLPLLMFSRKSKNSKKLPTLENWTLNLLLNTIASLLIYCTLIQVSRQYAICLYQYFIILYWIFWLLNKLKKNYKVLNLVRYYNFGIVMKLTISIKALFFLSIPILHWSVLSWKIMLDTMVELLSF